jgi:hypothetical protein
VLIVYLEAGSFYIMIDTGSSFFYPNFISLVFYRFLYILFVDSASLSAGLVAELVFKV